MSLNYLADHNQEIRAWLLKVFDRTAQISQQASRSLISRPCPVCGSVESTGFANNGFLDYSRCKRCSLVFQNPGVDSNAVNDGFEGGDLLLREYFSIMQKYKTPTPSKPNPLTHGKLKDIYGFKTAGSLLDVGCSVGDFLHLAKHFYKVEGLEINPLTAAIAEQHFTVHKSFLAELHLAPTYDVVTLHQILYGVPDPLQLLRDIHGVLKRDGILYVNTPNSDSYATKLFSGKCCHLYGYTSLNVFNPCALSGLAERAGFKVLSLRTEWLDIYVTDVQEYYEHPDQFIHKRNCHLPEYERKITEEDRLHQELGLDLGLGGNYMVAVLGKA